MYPLPVSKFVSRLEKVTAVVAALFLNAVVFGWWAPRLSSPLSIMLEYTLPALFAIWYAFLEGLWMRSRRKDDIEGNNMDFPIALAILANALLLAAVILVRGGFAVSTHAGAYPLGMLIIFIPGLARDIVTSFMVRFRLASHLK